LINFRLDATQEELSEYQQQSRELESEMETQLTQLEKKNGDLTSQLQRASDERDQLRVSVLCIL
jgi:hypothetical protein